MFRLAANVSVAATTAVASTAPASTARTGTSVRPRPGSSANRTPATAGEGSPAAWAARTTPDARARDRVPARHPVRRLPVGDHHGHAAQDHDQGERAEPEDRPVQVDPAGRLDPLHRPEQRQRGQRDGHGGGEQRPGGHRAQDAGQPVGRGGGGPGAQRPQHLGVAGAGAQLAGDRTGCR